jgi:YD repeat-containing protein
MAGYWRRPRPRTRPTPPPRADASKRLLSFDDEAGVRYTYVHDALGRVRQVLLPDGRKHTASYDGHGRPSQIVREGIATIDVGYHPVSGLPESKRFSSPSGDLHRTVTWGYDAIGRVTEERHLDSTGASTDELDMRVLRAKAQLGNPKRSERHLNHP